MNRQELLRLARVGAQARIDALQREIDGIHKQFPGLSARRGRAAGVTAGTIAAKRRLSPAARKRISDAAKKRWTEWRKKNKKA
jgi:hypothetical protein